MTNFVNFVTDKIKPVILRSYLNGAGDDIEFTGSDASTSDYTKFGYLCSVYRSMLRDGTDTDDVRSFISDVSAFVDEDGTPNYKNISPPGYTIAEMSVYDARNDKLFKISDLTNVIGGDSFDFYVSSCKTPAQSNVGTAVHMMIEYGLDLAIGELPAEAFLGTSSSNRALSPFMYALKRASDENMSGERMATYQIIKSKVADGYNDTFGENQLDSGFSSGEGVNEIAKFIMSTGHNNVQKSATEIMSMVTGNSSPSALEQAVTKSNGISKHSITFDLGIYEGLVSQDESNTGYNPLFMYVYKYKESVHVPTLNILASKFSPFSISVKNGSTEGFNVIGMVARYLTISSGEWTNQDLATWLKNRLSELTGDKYKIFASSGNSRDFSGGKTINAFGAINNILSSINIDHRQYYSDKSENDPAYDPSSLMSSALPDAIDAAFYEEWMEEYGQTIE